MTKTIKEQLIGSESFDLDSDGLYAIKISASCMQGRQLRVEIDGDYFREVPARDNIQKYNVAASWNGNKLLGLEQTNIFLMNLETGQHNLSFYSKTAILTEYFGPESKYDVGTYKIEWSYDRLGDKYGLESAPSKLKFDLNLKSQKRDRQPWINIITRSIPLESLSYSAILSWRDVWDGDDIKIIIDGRTRQAEINYNKYWIESAFTGKNDVVKASRLVTHLDNGSHVIEFWGDQTPELRELTIEMKQSETRDEFFTPQQNALNKVVLNNFPNAVNMDCYAESYSEGYKLGVKIKKSALIVYDPEYDINDKNITSRYLIYFWDYVLQRWIGVKLYPPTRNSAIKIDDGINLAEQYDAKEPLPPGWHAFFIGTTWLSNQIHRENWYRDDHWMVYKLK